MNKKRDFQDLMRHQWSLGKYLCVGLDVDIEKLPEHIRKLTIDEAIFRFCNEVVEATSEYAAAYKPNISYFERYGASGMDTLRRVIDSITSLTPDTPVIIDAKRGDIHNTNNGYVQNLFDYFSADATTLHPYLGEESLAPFTALRHKGLFILCRTSNPGAGEFQDLICEGIPLYLHVAKNVSSKWHSQATLGLVVGATYHQELRCIREIAPDIPILIPGIGAQGGDLRASVYSSMSTDGTFKILINASRSIIYAGSGIDYCSLVSASAKTFTTAITDVMLNAKG